MFALDQFLLFVALPIVVVSGDAGHIVGNHTVQATAVKWCCAN